MKALKSISVSLVVASVLSVAMSGCGDSTEAVSSEKSIDASAVTTVVDSQISNTEETIVDPIEDTIVKKSSEVTGAYVMKSTSTEYENLKLEEDDTFEYTQTISSADVESHVTMSGTYSYDATSNSVTLNFTSSTAETSDKSQFGSIGTSSVVELPTKTTDI